MVQACTPDGQPFPHRLLEIGSPSISQAFWPFPNALLPIPVTALIIGIVAYTFSWTVVTSA